MATADVGQSILNAIAGLNVGGQVKAPAGSQLAQFAQAVKTPNNGLSQYVNGLRAAGEGNFGGVRDPNEDIYNNPNYTPNFSGIIQQPATAKATQNAAVSNYLHALQAQANAQKGENAAGTGAYTGPSASQLINQYVASEDGAAPNAANYFTTTPYTTALSSLASGVKGAQGNIASAYKSANADEAANNKTFQQAMNAGNTQLKQSEQGLTSTIAGLVNSAVAQSGAGGGVQAFLAPLQAQAASQNAATAADNNTINQLFASDERGDANDLATNQQAALGSLASGAAQQRDQITSQEADDRAKAMLQYQTDLASYNKNAASEKASLMSQLQSQAAKNLAGTTITNKQAAANTAAQWLSDPNNQNGAQLNAAWNTILGAVPDTKNAAGVVTKTGRAAPKSAAQALQDLAMYASQPGAGITPFAPNSPMYNILAGNLNRYFGGGSTTTGGGTPSQAYLAQLAALNGL